MGIVWLVITQYSYFGKSVNICPTFLREQIFHTYVERSRKCWRAHLGSANSAQFRDDIRIIMKWFGLRFQAEKFIFRLLACDEKAVA